MSIENLPSKRIENVDEAHREALRIKKELTGWGQLDTSFLLMKLAQMSGEKEEAEKYAADIRSMVERETRVYERAAKFERARLQETWTSRRLSRGLLQVPRKMNRENLE